MAAVAATAVGQMAPLAGQAPTGPTPTPTPWPVPANVEAFTVRTASPLNREVPFYVRRPRRYEKQPDRRAYRILYVCPPFNQDALGIMNRSALLAVADARDWFVVSATFRQEGKDVRDRKLSYYYPEGFSGKAVLEALEQIARKHPVDTGHILMQGISGGAQFVHRFALWAPERVAAVAVNSSSWFDEPGPGAARVAWLVTIGESDASFDATLRFVDQLRAAGAAPLFRSYIGMVHEGDARVDALDDAFLRFYDDLTRPQLGKRAGLLERQDPKPALSAEAMPFVGDAQDWRYFPNTAENRENVSEDSRVFLPSESIAALWGKPEPE